MKKTATWYFDIISPFAYLQSKQITSLRDQLDIKPTPVLFAGLLNHWGQLGPAEIEPKRQFIFRQSAWRAQCAGIPFTLPPTHPFNPLWGLRLIIAHGSSFEAIDTVFDHVWANGFGLVEDEDREILAKKLGMTLKEADDITQDPAVKSHLVENTKSAVADRIFGVPSVLVDDQIFWGDDSQLMLQDWLKGDLDFESEIMRRIDTVQASSKRV